MGKGLSDLTKDERIQFNKELGILIVFVVFTILCYLTGGFMSSRTINDYSDVLPDKGGLYGPFRIESDNTSAMIKVERTARIRAFHWDALDIEILDSNKQYLSSFGTEFWKEIGRDSDGRWEASQYRGELGYFFASKGEYYLKVSVSSNKKRNSEALYAITVRQQRGSAELFYKVGFVMMFLCVFVFIWVFRRFEGDD